jgi:hypothetical protein
MSSTTASTYSVTNCISHTCPNFHPNISAFICSHQFTHNRPNSCSIRFADSQSNPRAIDVTHSTTHCFSKCYPHLHSNQGSHNVPNCSA